MISQTLLALRVMRCGLLAALLTLAPAAAFAQAGVVGLWRTVDDATGEPKALVRITEKDGVFAGKIERLFKTDPKWSGLCESCRDARKGQPVLGMVILTSMKLQGDDYVGGEILDPESGNVYRCKMRLVDSGRALEVRGFIGIALFGRTQVWQREK
jgi:uncharacterized protein (DUF2147 family)